MSGRWKTTLASGGSRKEGSRRDNTRRPRILPPMQDANSTADRRQKKMRPACVREKMRTLHSRFAQTAATRGGRPHQLCRKPVKGTNGGSTTLHRVGDRPPVAFRASHTCRYGEHILYAVLRHEPRQPWCTTSIRWTGRGGVDSETSRQGLSEGRGSDLNCIAVLYVPEQRWPDFSGTATNIPPPGEGHWLSFQLVKLPHEEQETASQHTAKAACTKPGKQLAWHTRRFPVHRGQKEALLQQTEGVLHTGDVLDREGPLGDPPVSSLDDKRLK